MCLATFLGGCGTPSLQSDQIMVTYESMPPGAMIYKGNQAVGTAPQSFIYTLNANTVRGTFQTDQQMGAIWPSGARSFGASINTGIKHSSIVFSRPSNAPGMDIDLSYARRVQQDDDASAALLINSFNAGLTANQPRPVFIDQGVSSPKPGGSLRCSTTSNAGPGIVNPTFTTNCQ